MGPIALTMGDPAGIGPDITTMAWQARQSHDLPVFAVLAPPAFFQLRTEDLGLNIPQKVISKLEDAYSCFEHSLPILPIECAEQAPAAGAPRPELSAAICASIAHAVDLIYQQEAAAIVTNPINKALLYGSGFNYPGHTEYLASLARDKGDEATPVMMLTGGGLRVIPATIHIALEKVPSALTAPLIRDVLAIVVKSLRHYFAIENPRIAVTGLNPHAGENGALGKQEEEIIKPAIEMARMDGVTITGPHPADTLFHQEARSSYDAVIAMYHDQALIPVKTIAFDTGVNVTLGLPFIRTSPDHGTAYGIAGTGQANPSSLIAALHLARKMAQARAFHP